MERAHHILLLAGSLEARHVADALSAQGIRHTAWLSQAPRVEATMPRTPILKCHADAAQMRADMALGGYTAVLDASHVFDQRVTRQASTAARALGLPYLRLQRAAWDVKAHARWRAAPDVAAACAMIKSGARVFSTTGWDSLPDYEDFRGETLFVRQTRQHTRSALYPFVEFIFGEPPFDARQERALFETLRCDTLVCRNLGGVASRPKLDAAVHMGLDVILIDRPVAPADLATVADGDAALAWVNAL